MSPSTVLLLAGGLVLLVAGAEGFVRGAVRVAAALGIPPLVIGLTVVAFGTSAPEIAVSVQSAFTGAPELALGNALGSNICNVLLILGVSASIAPLVVARQLVRLDVPVMVGVSFLVLLLGLDSSLGRLDGALLLVGAAAYTAFLVVESRRESRSDPGDSAGWGSAVPPGAHRPSPDPVTGHRRTGGAPAGPPHMAAGEPTEPMGSPHSTSPGSRRQTARYVNWRPTITIRRIARTLFPTGDAEGTATNSGGAAFTALLILGGLVLLVTGSRWLVSGAVTVAQSLGVSELVIGLTVVALGTSLPELATSIVATVRGERDLAVGNIVGSNIFNILLVLGLASFVAPAGIPVSAAVVRFDIPVMIAVAVACLPIFFSGHRIDRWEGWLFLGYYVAYIGYLILASAEHAALSVYSAIMAVFVIPLTAITLAIVFVRS